MRWGTSQWGSTQWGSYGAVAAQGAKNLSEFRSLLAAYSAGPATQPLEPTRAHTTTERIRVLAGTGFGISIVAPYVNISHTPDIVAVLYGWAELNLAVSITPMSLSVIWGYIKVIQQGTLDISSSIRGMSVTDLGALVFSVAPEDISASIVPVLGFITADIFSVAPRDIRTYIGGHLPSLLSAVINAVFPAQIGGWIRGGLSSSESLLSAITASGGYRDMVSRVLVTARTTRDIRGIIRVRMPVDITATLSSWAESSISATICHIFLGPTLTALIKATASSLVDISGYVRVNYRGVVEAPAYLKTIISAHTGPKLLNRGVFPKAFPLNRFLFGTGSGLSFVSIEPIFSLCPDLAAIISGRPFYTSSLGALIRGIQLTGGLADISARLVGVTPALSVSTVNLLFDLFRNIPSSITSTGGITALRGSIKVLFCASTGTAADAHFTFTRSTTRQFFSTTHGVLISTPVVTAIKRWSFINTHPSPDIYGVIQGWGAADMSVSIGVLFQSSLLTYIGVLDSSHMRDLSSVIRGVVTTDLGGHIATVGYFTNLLTSINPRFEVSTLRAHINGFVGVLSREFVCVHTKPFVSLGAMINFNSSYSCFKGSYFMDVGARLVTSTSQSLSLNAVITALREFSDMSVSIYGRKQVRVNTLALYFRSAVRDDQPLRASITGWARQNQSSLPTTIFGEFNQSSLTAAVTCIRIKPSLVFTAEDVLLVNIRHPSVKKTVEVLFGSGSLSYVYDPSSGSVFSDTGEEWSILIRNKPITTDFYDGIPVEQRYVRSITDYDSLDEAIRSSLNSIISPDELDLGCAIVARGAVCSLPVSVFATGFDRMSDLGAKIFQVHNEPVLLAYIAAAGAMSGLGAAVSAIMCAASGLAGTITGWGDAPLGASIVAI